LPTALRLANAQNPEIALARERIREALAVQGRAEVLWLPDLEVGTTWMRHDGQIQRAVGEVFTTSRSSLFVGGGPAVAVEVSEALFAPLAAQQLTVAARAGAARATNEQLLDVAVAYLDLLQTYAALQIAEETYTNARHLLDLTESYERSGKGAAADTARARTEVNLRERDRLEIRGRIGIVSARLAQLLQLPPDLPLRPIEPALVPIALVPEQAPLPELIAQALINRPELAENRALIAAALERWRAAKVAPWVPEVRLAYAAGGYGGGINSFFGAFNGRGDFTATAVWELENLGLGNRAQVRERHSRYAQATYRQVSLEARVAAQVVAAFSEAFASRGQFVPAAEGVKAARESYRLNEERIRRAPEQGRPIELLQAIQALARARQDYLEVVADYNRAQFRLHTALGNPPLCALESMASIPVAEPTVPPEPARPEGTPDTPADEGTEAH
jgi:outer membrane protein TolC